MRLSFETFGLAQAARIQLFHPPGTRQWSYADWGNALAGECGEACNVAKKLMREEDGVAPPTQAPREALLEALGEELADTVTYAVSLAEMAGIDLTGHMVRKFNRVSEERDCPVRLQENGDTVIAVGLSSLHTGDGSRA